MKRFVFKLLGFLLLGAMINVTVAWAGVIGFHQRTEIEFTPEECWSFLFPAATFDEDRNSAMVFGGTATAVGVEFIEVHSIDRRFDGMLGRVIAGLPCRALTGDRAIEGEPPKGSNRLSFENPWVPFEPYNPTHLPIPLQPIWPGFALNTFFYAAIVWGLFAVPASLKRRRRMKHGLCVRCAYPVGVSGCLPPVRIAH